MSINRNEISTEIFNILSQKVSSIERDEYFDKTKCYLDFSDEDKNKLNNVTGTLIINTIPNDFFLFYMLKDTDECYILVWGQEDLSDGTIEIEEVTLADLCILCHEKQLYVSEDISKEEIYDRLFAYEDDKYSGYTYDDLKVLFKPFSLYKVDINSIITERGGYCVYAYWLMCKAKESDFPWDEDTIAEIEKTIVSNNEALPYRNIALSLIAKQWTHIFLESYRIIEHTFSALYLKDVTQTIKASSKIMSVVFEETLNWRPPEESSIEKIFNMLNEQPSFSIILSQMDSIKSKYDGNMNLYKWYYKNIRNRIAHFRIIHNDIELNDDEWNTIIKFNFMTIQFLYDKYKEELKD